MRTLLTAVMTVVGALATNEKIKSFDVSSIVDNEFVQSGMDRHLGP